MRKVWIFEQAVHHRRSKLKIGWTIKKDLNNNIFKVNANSVCKAVTQTLSLVQTCWVNTFHIELIYLLVTSSSSVNGLCYELWKFRKNHPSLQIWWSFWVSSLLWSHPCETIKILVVYVFPVLSCKYWKLIGVLARADDSYVNFES